MGSRLPRSNVLRVLCSHEWHANKCRIIRESWRHGWWVCQLWLTTVNHCHWAYWPSTIHYSPSATIHIYSHHYYPLQSSKSSISNMFESTKHLLIYRGKRHCKAPPPEASGCWAEHMEDRCCWWRDPGARLATAKQFIWSTWFMWI